MTIITVNVYADMLLICHHLRQPSEVHHVVFQRAPRVPMSAGSVPRRRRGMEHFTWPVRLLVCFRRLQTYANAAVIVMTVQFFDGGWLFGRTVHSVEPAL